MAYKYSVVITGGTMNLGYEAALLIAKTHPDYQVVISSRNDNQAAEAINTATGQNNVAFIPLDLADTKSMRQFQQTWAAANYPPIKALLLNAGLQFPADTITTTKEGLEATFAINHVGHVLLFHLLYPYLAEGARVVVTTSGTHDPAQKTPMPPAVYHTAEDLAHPKPNDGVPGRQRYTSSKLCNVLWTYELDRRLRRQNPSRRRNIAVNAFDPGLMPGTGLAREGTGAERFLWHTVMPRIVGLMRLVLTHNIHTPRESAAALVRLALDEAEGVSGKYFEGLKAIPSSVDSYDEAKALDLWDWTLRYVTNGDEGELARFNELA
ncbi:short-chain dehydrogenase [Podospora appendiculata]|uniref:Short-chain dehydrogenase n=1 Tax=Podospora appendiculata TaxID=314037 RepID=A0AAE0X7T2_9PEZI|nr:short-chain dehydrogenase [Podospora appendiculata]